MKVVRPDETRVESDIPLPLTDRISLNAGIVGDRMVGDLRIDRSRIPPDDTVDDYTSASVESAALGLGRVAADCIVSDRAVTSIQSAAVAGRIAGD